MKRILLAAMAASVLAASGPAMADPQPYEAYRDRQEQRGSDDRRDDRRGPQQANRDDRRAPQVNRGQRRAEARAQRRYAAARYQRPRGYRAHQWRYGERLPASYRSRAYEVDHRRYGLSAPPRGYYYVRVNNDVVLVSRNSGIIASVILLLFR
jgi:Ni/Co efflux regulator RcnB